MDQRMVYLSGPISGHPQERAVQWRRYVADRLRPGLTVINPLRDAVDFSVVSERRLDDPERLRHLQHGREILERNRMDIARCDALLANFLDSHRVSIGAVGEVFWADAFRKPVIIVREPHGNLHDHGLLNAISSRCFETLDEAIHKINDMLLV